MASNDPWRPVPERYRALLIIQVRKLLYRESRLRRRFDSSDIVQDTLLKAQQKIDDFRGKTEAELLKWLHELLYTTFMDAVRRDKAQKRDISLEQERQAAVAESSARIQDYLTANEPSPSDQAQRKEMLLSITSAIDRLPEDQRNVIVQRDLLGASIQEIAETLGRSEKSVAGLLLRGRRRLRELLNGLKD